MATSDTIFRHYVRIDIKGPNEFEFWLVEEIFNNGEYQRAQIKWAMECPYNRNGVREKYKWDDATLDKNPSVAVAHFVEMHGDEWFRENLRPKFIKTKQIKLEGVAPACFLLAISGQCKKCPKCMISQLGVVP